MFPFNGKPKRRFLYENQRGQTRVRLASIVSGHDIEYYLFFYKIEKYAVLKMFATVKFTDLSVCEDLIRDVKAHVKEMMR